MSSKHISGLSAALIDKVAWDLRLPPLVQYILAVPATSNFFVVAVEGSATYTVPISTLPAAVMIIFV